MILEKFLDSLRKMNLRTGFFSFTTIFFVICLWGATSFACQFLVPALPMLQIEEVLEENLQHVKKMKENESHTIPYASGIPCQFQKFSTRLQMVGDPVEISGDKNWTFHSWMPDDFSNRIQVHQSGRNYIALTSKNIANAISDGKMFYADIAVIDRSEYGIEVPHLHEVLLIFKIRKPIN